MALRVLLADESSTIKKVFQLALQDFAVDVRPVNIGVDVVPVAKSFNPDIIFADVLLQKRSGYEVCAEVKSDPDLSGVPVVLMWSGFMEMDEDKYQASQANGRLEKPFDVKALRSIVTEMVPKTQSQRLSQFLNFPKMPEINDPVPALENEKTPVPAPKSVDEFKQVSIPAMKSSADRFRIQVPADDANDIPVNLSVPDDPIDVENIFRGVDEPEEFTMHEPKGSQAPAVDLDITSPSINFEAFQEQEQESPPPPFPRKPAAAPPPPPDVEKVIRAQAQDLIGPALQKMLPELAQKAIEAAVWKIVPELAQQIIEREIQKLLREKDKTL